MRRHTREDIIDSIMLDLDKMQERLRFYQKEDHVRDLVLRTYERELHRLSEFADEHHQSIRYHVWLDKYKSEIATPKIIPRDLTQP